MYTYLWCFFLFSFLGWCCEVVYAAFVEHRFVNRGFLNGPICPIYGFGVVLIDFLLRPVGHSGVALLLGSFLVGSGLEWLAGFLLEKLFHQKWWDYSDEPHNLGGYICLKFSLLWAAAGTTVVLALVPACQRVFSLIPRTLGWALLMGMLVLAISDFLVTAVAIFGMNRQLKRLNVLAEKLRPGTDVIREGSDKLGETLYSGAVAAGQLGGKAMEQALELKSLAAEKGEGWKEEALRLRAKTAESLQKNFIYRRILAAFPDLRSLRHNEQMDNLLQNVSEMRKSAEDALRRRDEAAAAVYELKIPKGQERPFAYGFGYTKLFWVFLAGSVIGFVCETIYALAAPPHVLELRTSLVFGPFVLIYGIGAVVFTLTLRKMYNQRDIMIFFATMVMGAGVEYLCSFFQQVIFGTVSWEYSGSKLNLGGRTNLMYSFFWGILGVLWVKDMFPAFARALQKVPKKIGRVVTIVISILLAADMLLSAGAVSRWSRREANLPAANPVESFFDAAFPDDVMSFIYPHMTYVGRPDPPDETPGLPDDPAE